MKYGEARQAMIDAGATHGDSPERTYQRFWKKGRMHWESAMITYNPQSREYDVGAFHIDASSEYHGVVLRLAVGMNGWPGRRLDDPNGHVRKSEICSKVTK